MGGLSGRAAGQEKRSAFLRSTIMMRFAIRLLDRSAMLVIKLSKQEQAPKHSPAPLNFRT